MEPVGRRPWRREQGRGRFAVEVQAEEGQKSIFNPPAGMRLQQATPWLRSALHRPSMRESKRMRE